MTLAGAVAAVTPMRTILLTALLLLSAAATIPAASAQQQGQLVISLQGPLEPLTEGATHVISGVAVLTVDITAYTAMSGIPVQYSVLFPEWASAVVTPSSDVFQLPPVPPGMTSVTMMRPFQVMVTPVAALDEDKIDILSLHAVTSPSSPFGMSFSGRGDTQVAYDAPDKHDEECELLTAEEKAALLAAGAEAYNAYAEEQAADESGDEVTVQGAGATPLSTPWVVVAAFGLVGAGVGLALKRRLGKDR